MNPRRLPIGVLMIVPIVLGFGLYAFTGQAQEVEDPNATSPTAVPTLDRLIDGQQPIDEYFATKTAEAAASLTAVDYDLYLTQTAGQPTPTPPVTSRGDFHDGAWVRVNAGAGDCLNARNSPSLESEYVIVNICVPDGYEGPISGYTQQADGHWWWQLAGLGWVAEDYLVYLREFDPRANLVPELSGAAGKVAFLRGNDVWMMRPDGSDQTLLVDNDERGDGYVPGPRNLGWSPDGTRLSYNIDRLDKATGTDPGSVDLHVLTIDGSTVTDSRVFEDVAGGGWSPDGVRLGIVRDPSPDQMGGGVLGIPAVLDVTTGGQLVLGSEPYWQQYPPSFNHDGSLLLVSESPFDGATYHPSLAIYTADGAEHDRIEFASDGSIGYASPSWSPTGNRIAMHVSRRQDENTYTSQYEVYDVDARAFVAAAPVPKYSDRAGGGCGGGDMWNTTWSLDGKRVLYSFMFGDTGANGIWSWDVATGQQSVVYAANAGDAAPGYVTSERDPHAWVMFSASSHPDAYIFAGTHDEPANPPRIITDGSSPAWWVPR